MDTSRVAGACGEREGKGGGREQGGGAFTLQIMPTFLASSERQFCGTL